MPSTSAVERHTVANISTWTKLRYVDSFSGDVYTGYFPNYLYAVRFADKSGFPNYFADNEGSESHIIDVRVVVLEPGKARILHSDNRQFVDETDGVIRSGLLMGAEIEIERRSRIY